MTRWHGADVIFPIPMNITDGICNVKFNVSTTTFCFGNLETMTNTGAEMWLCSANATSTQFYAEWSVAGMSLQGATQQNITCIKY
ncbi:MAG: hypothetical protein ACLRFN_01300 [Alphaproteobacteria bacterium]